MEYLLFYILIISIIILIVYFYNKESEQAKYENISGYEFNKSTSKILHNNLDKVKNNSTTPEEIIVSNFIIGDILEHNIVPNLDEFDRQIALGMAEDYYLAALDNIIIHPDNIMDTEIGTEHIVDRVAQFIPNLEPDLNLVRDNMRRTKVKNMSKKEYYTKSPISSDPQNVHDTEVVNELAIRYNRIKNKNQKNPKSESLFDIEEAINKHNFQSHKEKQNALNAFYIMCKGNNISSLSDTEDNVIYNIWNRIKDNDNKDNQNELKKSFMNSLSSIYENDKPVCINGRCSRMIDSLTLLDTDKKINQPIKTTEILRSEILNKSYKIIQDELAATDNDTREIYNGNKSGDIIKFESYLKDKIETTIRDDYPEVKPSTLDNLIKDAQAGVE